jgi:hypothetical protein
MEMSLDLLVRYPDAHKGLWRRTSERPRAQISVPGQPGRCGKPPFVLRYEAFVNRRMIGLMGAGIECCRRLNHPVIARAAYHVGDAVRRAIEQSYMAGWLWVRRIHVRDRVRAHTCHTRDLTSMTSMGGPLAGADRRLMRGVINARPKPAPGGPTVRNRSPAPMFRSDPYRANHAIHAQHGRLIGLARPVRWGARPPVMLA